ncbi:AGE family epimerase/isomerase [Oceanobacillus jeddahense]|uniref:AGE family epimerase/isomerase n=1 Tax=Oceanobacillus jeddahense TaxID=1462527 RepID=UPI000595E50A|nr:AGE family epimerase/isomerase [Oceanobacillus jeddahense]
MDNELLKHKYIEDLERNFLPFWEKSVDDTFGGVYTCYTNSGDDLISDRKYIWSQGRFLWLGCKLLQLKEQGIIQLSEKWSHITDDTYSFLKNHALMRNHHVVFAVERNGEKIKDQMDTSIFADCFYVLGCNAYANLNNKVETFEHVMLIYHTIKERISKNEFQSDPYPIPDGYLSHSIPMMLINVAQELYETAKKLNAKEQFTLLSDIDTFFHDILYLQNSNRIIEMYSGDSSTLLERHMNPGHTVECAWFILHSLLYIELENKEKHIKNVERIVKNAITVGWDEKNGGIFRFVDKEGGRPQGKLIGTPFEELILESWDTKLWWPHSEALYSTLLLYSLTNEQTWIEKYKKVETYVFNTFPNENEEIGEWIQIRDRTGRPINQIVALPVKDPFHIIRAYIKIIELLEGSENFATRIT